MDIEKSCFLQNHETKFGMENLGLRVSKASSLLFYKWIDTCTIYVDQILTNLAVQIEIEYYFVMHLLILLKFH